MHRKDPPPLMLGLWLHLSLAAVRAIITPPCIKVASFISAGQKAGVVLHYGQLFFYCLELGLIIPDMLY